METRPTRTTALIAGGCWLVLAVYGLVQVVAQDHPGNYLVFSMALLAGAALGIAAVWTATAEDASRPRLRMASLAVGGVGVASSIVAWALPLWMALLGAGFALFAVAAGPSSRRALALLAGGQLLGIVVLIGSIEAEIGTPDEYGDYPAAGGVALLFTSVVTIAALAVLARGRSELDRAMH